MKQPLDNDIAQRIQAFVDAPFGSLRVKTLRVGRIAFHDLEVVGREAANTLYNLMELSCVRTQRNRVRRDGKRFIDVLPPGTPGRLLSEEVADYVAEKRRVKLKPDSIKTIERTLTILGMVTGDIEVSRIDRQQIQRMWELLRWAPSNLANDPDLKQQSVDALIELGMASNKPALAEETMALHHRVLSAFFNYLVEHKAIGFSPMKGFKLPSRSKIKSSRKTLRLFSDADLQRIFGPDNFLPWASAHPHRWWCPILALYTGARVSEIAQLHLADVIREPHGGLSIQIHAVADPDLDGKEVRSRMTIKGNTSVRSVPLTDPVLAAGFGDFIADLERYGHQRLFPHLSAGVNRTTGETNARYSATLQQDFGRYLKSLGFAKGIGFHAFRHTLATDLDDQGISETDLALITGHAVEKRAPVLHDNYYHPGERQPQHRRRRQQQALKAYQPNVQVPVYRAGQFDQVLVPGNVFYP
ncbi:site-specific integrase [Luteimonas sp. SMYT11W]|uniref:Site-specific integrase n=1 Tax=Luteimonas flava TaxID=3115822 RepID=A0ABU7WFH7_9GAMM